MKLICPISSLSWTTSGSASGYGSGISVHPYFSLPLSTLSEHFNLWQAGNPAPHHWTDENIYLLGLAILRTLPSRWDYPCSIDSSLPALAANLHSLHSLALKLYSHTLPSDSDSYPTIVISKDTHTLEQLPGWIETFTDFLLSDTRVSAPLVLSTEQKLESKLQYLSEHNTPPHKLAKLLSKWAALAGKFPSDLVSLWTKLIEDSIVLRAPRDYKTESLNNYLELLEHLEFHLAPGTPYGSMLLSKIRKRVAALQSFTTNPAAFLLGESADTSESSLFSSLTSPTPTSKPTPPERGNYPNSVAYTRAKLRYQSELFAWERSRRIADRG